MITERTFPSPLLLAAPLFLVAGAAEPIVFEAVFFDEVRVAAGREVLFAPAFLVVDADRFVPGFDGEALRVDEAFFVLVFRPAADFVLLAFFAAVDLVPVEFFVLDFLAPADFVLPDFFVPVDLPVVVFAAPAMSILLGFGSPASMPGPRRSYCNFSA